MNEDMFKTHRLVAVKCDGTLKKILFEADSPEELMKAFIKAVNTEGVRYCESLAYQIENSWLRMDVAEPATFTPKYGQGVE